ncbi:hypothetical protein FOL47_003874 [Perkinsus chesapeaki]|uniref:Uncharacterized protein n=1 Tax=Perkinsus chesapeaki TaxID=330153 RepID=A0A7J6M6R6_PERCH|nr:hypothetical protein FOL47_003874 [Perkinsus chesapeaki]
MTANSYHDHTNGEPVAGTLDDTIWLEAGRPGSKYAPLEYDITLRDFNCEIGTFAGRTLIKLKRITGEGKLISLHAVGLKISFLRVDGLPARRYWVDHGLVVIEAGTDRETVEVDIEYVGQLIVCGHSRHGIIAPRGLFAGNCNDVGQVSTLDAGDTEGSHIACRVPVDDMYIGTSLEPRHARRVFPCVDDPAFKASFAVRCSTGEHMRAISISERKPAAASSGDWIEFRTPQDVRLPTYAVGIFIGQFSEHDFGSQVSICYFPREQHSSFSDSSTLELPDKRQRQKRNVQELTPTVAGHAAQFAFEQMTEWFGSIAPYPALPDRLRIVALPHHRGLGLETFGCISVKDTYCMVPSIPSALGMLEECRRKVHRKAVETQQELKLFTELISRRRRVVRLMCHEVSHMWFGDMCTPESFADLWLKEGMARLLEFVMCDLMPNKEPSAAGWMESEGLNQCLGDRVWEHFLTEVQFDAMLADASPSRSHPIEYNCDRPTTGGGQQQQHPAEDCEVLFDNIAYGKGACVLRMLRGAVGHDNFIRGLRILLERHNQSTYTKSDLWRAMADAAGLETTEIAGWMDAWLREPGLPIVCSTVEEVDDGYRLRMWQLETSCVISSRPPWLEGTPNDTPKLPPFEQHFRPRRVVVKAKVWWISEDGNEVIQEDVLRCWLLPCHVQSSPLEVAVPSGGMHLNHSLKLLINPELEAFVLCPPPNLETIPVPSILTNVEQCALVTSLALNIKMLRECGDGCTTDAGDSDWQWKAMWSVAGSELSAAGGAFYTAVEAEAEDIAIRAMRIHTGTKMDDNDNNVCEETALGSARERFRCLASRVESRQKAVYGKILGDDVKPQPSVFVAALDEELWYANALLRYVRNCFPSPRNV